MSSHIVYSALTIAGSDSCGGAGIQADLKTFTVLGVYGTSVLTAITAQNTLGVRAALELTPEIVLAQFNAVTSDIPVSAVKTGMLASVAMIELIAGLVKTLKCPYICDPVMVAKSGDSLIAPDAIGAIRKRLFPLAAVITPNRFEVKQMLGKSVQTLDEAREATRELAAMGPRAVIIKGIPSGDRIVDVLYAGGAHELFEGERHPAGRSHGSGCTFSAAITAELAKGRSLSEAVLRAREVIDVAMRESFSACKGIHPVNVMACLRSESFR